MATDFECEMKILLHFCVRVVLDVSGQGGGEKAWVAKDEFNVPIALSAFRDKGLGLPRCTFYIVEPVPVVSIKKASQK